MRQSFIPRVGSILCGLGLVVLLGLGAVFGLPGRAGAAPGTPPHVTVFVNNYHAEYDMATAEFLERQFDFADSPAFGLVSYTVVTTLTSDALAGSAALVIDESADMDLTDAEAAVIHDFVKKGGRVGLFAYPRHYWDQAGANAAAYQKIADLWNISAVGEPAAGEVASGESSANVPEPEDGILSLAGPYALAGQSVKTLDELPFSPITAAGAMTVMTSPVLAGSPVAVANAHGIFVTNSIGDAVQGADASVTYGQFVTDSIVWLANSAQLLPYKLYLPLVSR